MAVTDAVDAPDAPGPSGEAGSGATRREAAGSLRPVLDIIPPEAYENPTWKGLLYLARDLVLYAALVVALVFVANPLLVLPLWVLMALVISGLFIIGHDAGHGALFANPKLNRFVGRLTMLPSWHVFEGWVLGHNRIHHSYTVRQGYDFVWHPYTPEQFAQMGALARLRHRIEWSWFGAGAYYIREVWWNKMIVGKPPARWVKSIRRDRFLVLGFVVVSSALLGWLGWSMTGTVAGAVWMVARVLIVPFLAFSFVIGSFVHVHHIAPDIRWWPKREWTKFKGQVEGTTVLHAPRGMDFFVHWIMIHVPHHVDMRIPMYNLELAADAIKAAYPDEVHEAPLRFRDFIANTRACKLYDFEHGRWMTYAEGAAALAATDPATDSAAA